MFNIKIVKIPLNADYQVDINKVRKSINSNTIGLVGSYPGYPHGTFDDIKQLSDLAVKYNLPLHVDACLGGFIHCFLKDSPEFDFRLPGVTSISADYHKYGLAPKGISVLLFKDKEIRKYHYFLYPKWQGGIYITPSFAGSRSAGVVAATAAVLCHVGTKKYALISKKIVDAIASVKKFASENLKMLKVMGNPIAPVIAFEGENILKIQSYMKSKGWSLALLNTPLSFHLAVTLANLPNLEDGTFSNDLKEAEEFIAKTPDYKIDDFAKMYGVQLNVPEEIAKPNMDLIVDGFTG